MTGRGEPAGVGFGLLGYGTDRFTEIAVGDVLRVQPGFDHPLVGTAVGFDEFERGTGLHDDPVSRARGELANAKFEGTVLLLLSLLHVTPSFLLFLVLFEIQSGMGCTRPNNLQDYFKFFP